MCDRWMGTNHVYIDAFCISHKADVNADEKQTTTDQENSAQNVFHFVIDKYYRLSRIVSQLHILNINFYHVFFLLYT